MIHPCIDLLRMLEAASRYCGNARYCETRGYYLGSLLGGRDGGSRAEVQGTMRFIDTHSCGTTAG